MNMSGMDVCILLGVVVLGIGFTESVSTSRQLPDLYIR